MRHLLVYETHYDSHHYAEVEADTVGDAIDILKISNPDVTNERVWSFRNASPFYSNEPVGDLVEIAKVTGHDLEQAKKSLGKKYTADKVNLKQQLAISKEKMAKHLDSLKRNRG